MALFGETKKPFSYDILREGEDTVLMIDLEQYPHVPSLEDDPVCMSRTIDILSEVGPVTKIIPLGRIILFEIQSKSRLKNPISLIFPKVRDLSSERIEIRSPKITGNTDTRISICFPATRKSMRPS